MTVATLAPPAPLVPHCPRPCLAAVARRAGTNLALGCLVPAAVFYTLFAAAGVWTAILATLAWSYGALGWRALTGRSAPALLVLTTAVLTARTAVALATDSPFLYFLQPVLMDGLIAAAFLGSLAAGRPVVARLANDFYPVDEELAARPRVARLFGGLTALWAALWLAKGSLGLWLLLTQSLEVYVPVKAALALGINVSAVLITLGAAAYVGRREGLLGG
jgi:uncharacterized membrane protein